VQILKSNVIYLPVKYHENAALLLRGTASHRLSFGRSVLSEATANKLAS